VLNPKYLNLPLLVIKFVNDAIRTAARRPQADELTLKWVSDPLGCFEERPEQEFDNC
jgi:hypothetical protein